MASLFVLGQRSILKIGFSLFVLTFAPEWDGKPFCFGSEVNPENWFFSGPDSSPGLVLSAFTLIFLEGKSFFFSSEMFGFFSLLFSSLFCRASRAFLFSIENSTIGLLSLVNTVGLLFTLRRAASASRCFSKETKAYSLLGAFLPPLVPATRSLITLHSVTFAVLGTFFTIRDFNLLSSTFGGKFLMHSLVDDTNILRFLSRCFFCFSTTFLLAMSLALTPSAA